MWTPLFVIVAVLALLQLATPFYYLVLRRAIRREPQPPRGGAPSVTVIVPTYNEEATIRERLRNLREHEYPAFDVLVVDDGSSDATRAIVRAFASEHPGFPLRLIEKEGRGGKVSAVRAALPHATGELVCLSDADSLWAPGALAAACARFADPKVGGVMGLRDLMGGSGFAQRVEDDYNAYYNTARHGESALDSTPVFCGPLSVYRREFVDAATFAESALLADDSETAMRIRKRGYRTVAEPRARFREGALSSLASYRHLRARRATGLQQLFLHHIDVALKPWRYGAFSFVVAANVVTLIVAPVALALLAVLAPLALWAVGGLLLLGAAVAAAALIATIAWAAPPSWSAWARLPVSFVQTQVALVWGLWMLRRRHNPIYDHVEGVRDAWRERAGTP